MNKKINYISVSILTLFLSFTLSAQEGKVTVDQDSDIDKLLEYKKDIKTTKVFRIQVYQSVDPDKADREKSNFLNTYEE